MDRATHLRVYRFDADVTLDGAVVRVLEDSEVTSGAGLLDALFVMSDAAGGELQAIDLATGRSDGTMAALLDFRLDPGSRPATTRRTLATHGGGVPAVVVETIGGALPPGGAALAALVGGTLAGALDVAVIASGGRLVFDASVAATTIAEVAPLLCAVL